MYGGHLLRHVSERSFRMQGRPVGVVHKGVMGRLAQAQTPRRHQGPPRAHGAAGAAMTGGGPVVNASPTGLLSRRGPCGAPGGPARSGGRRSR